MATIKSYTDLEQSKKLAEILPIESADMFWMLDSIDHYEAVNFPYSKSCANEDDGYPCWSLTTLLDILSKWAERVNEAGIAELSYEKITKWCVSILNCGKIKDCYADNPVDVCYEMILKLHELKML